MNSNVFNLDEKQKEFVYQLTGERPAFVTLDPAIATQIHGINQSIENNPNLTVEETRRLKGQISFAVGIFGGVNLVKGSDFSRIVLGINTTAFAGANGLASLSLAGIYAADGDSHNAGAELLKVAAAMAAVAGASQKIGAIVAAAGASGGIMTGGITVTTAGAAFSRAGVLLAVIAFVAQNSEEIIEEDRVKFMDFLDNVWENPSQDPTDFLMKFLQSGAGFIRHMVVSLAKGAWDLLNKYGEIALDYWDEIRPFKLLSDGFSCISSDLIVQSA